MQTRKILLAENNRDDEALLLLAIQRASIAADVVVLRDGKAVVDFYLDLYKARSRDIGQQPDLLLLDLALPKLDGLRVLGQLQWLYRHDLSQLAPVVVLSDTDDHTVVAEAFRRGAKGFLCKVTTVPQLVEAVQQTVSYWLGATLRPIFE